MSANWLALDLGATHWRMLLDSSQREPMYARGLVEANPTETFAAIRKQVVQSNFGGIGAVVCSGAPGCDADGRVSYWPNRTSWLGFDLKSELKTFAPRVMIEDDGVCAAFAELNSAPGRLFKSFIVLCLGTGIGSGLVVDGRIVRPRTEGFSLGHLRCDQDPLCRCGAHGCVQAVCQLTHSLVPLQRCVKDLVNLLSLEAVLVCGGRAASEGEWLGALRADLAGLQCQLLMSDDPDATSLRGAVLYAKGMLLP